jgi:hypothetical protein
MRVKHIFLGAIGIMQKCLNRHVSRRVTPAADSAQRIPSWSTT